MLRRHAVPGEATSASQGACTPTCAARRRLAPRATPATRTASARATPLRARRTPRSACTGGTVCSQKPLRPPIACGTGPSSARAKEMSACKGAAFRTSSRSSRARPKAFRMRARGGVFASTTAATSVAASTRRTPARAPTSSISASPSRRRAAPTTSAGRARTWAPSAARPQRARAPGSASMAIATETSRRDPATPPRGSQGREGTYNFGQSSRDVTHSWNLPFLSRQQTWAPVHFCSHVMQSHRLNSLSGRHSMEEPRQHWVPLCALPGQVLGAPASGPGGLRVGGRRCWSAVGRGVVRRGRRIVA